MRTELEPRDIESIVTKTADMLKPLISEKTKKETDTIYDVEGLSDYLKVTKKWIYERTHLKEIPHIKIDGTLRFRKKDIDKWLNSYAVPAVSSSSRALQRVK